MERWRELGYVPDSQGEEEEDLEALLLASQGDNAADRVIETTAAKGTRLSKPSHPVRNKSDGREVSKELESGIGPSTTQKNGRKRGIEKTTSQAGKTVTSGSSKRQRKGNAPKQQQKKKKKNIRVQAQAEQSAPFEPESSPDVLQMEDVMPRPMLARPSTNWKRMLPNDNEDEEDSLADEVSRLESVDNPATMHDSISVAPIHTENPISQEHHDQGEVEQTNPIAEDRVEAQAAPEATYVQPLDDTHQGVSMTLQSPMRQEDQTHVSPETAHLSPNAPSPMSVQPQVQPHSPPKYHGRALRPRTVLQERPYQVELARYALFCKQQGIPFHMPKSREHLHEQQRQHGHRIDDTGTSLNEEESQEYLEATGDRQSEMSGDDDEQMAPEGNTLERRPMGRPLPESSSRLHRPSGFASARVPIGSANRIHDPVHKRRKISHTYSNLHAPSKAIHQQAPSEFEGDTSGQHDAPHITGPSAEDDRSLIDLLNIPEVPSSQIAEEQDAPGPQEKTGLEMLEELDELVNFIPQLPGQDTTNLQNGSHSQEDQDGENSGSHEGLNLDLDSRSEGEDGGIDLNDIITVSDDDLPVGPTAGSDQGAPETTTPSSSPDETPSSRDLQRLQKRIKGVLPASWVRLEMKIQQEKDKANRERERKRKEAAIALRRARNDGKGVAQIVRKERRQSHGDKGTLEQDQQSRRRFVPDFLGEDALESSSGSEDDFVQHSTAPADSHILSDDGLGQLDLAGRPLDDGDIPEDNRIDYMLPPVQRGPRRSAPIANGQGRRKQARLDFGHAQTRTDTHSHHKSTSDKSLPINRSSTTRQVRLPSSSMPRDGRSTWRTDSTSTIRPWERTMSHGSLRDNGAPIATSRSLPTPSSSNPVTAHNLSVKPRQTRLDGAVKVGTGQGGAASSAPAPRPFQRSQSGRSAHSGVSVMSADPKCVNGSNPKTSHRRQPPSKDKSNEYTAKRGYILTSGRREALRPAGLENTALPIRLERHALKRVWSTNQAPDLSSTNVIQPTLSNIAKPITGRPPSPVQANPQLERYLYEDENDGPAWTAQSHDGRNSSPKQQKRHGHLHRHTSSLRNKVNGDDSRVNSLPTVHTSIARKHCKLKSLDTLEAFPTVDFNIFHLPAGTHFHQSTFIGSGELYQAINVDSRQFDIVCGTTVISHHSVTYRWSAWTETVASELTNIFDEIRNILAGLCNAVDAVPTITQVEHIIDLYRSTIAYISGSLYFMDSIDRSDFVSRCIQLLQGNFEVRRGPLVPNDHDCGHEVLLRSLDLVLAAQIFKIAKMMPPLAALETEVDVLLSRAANLVLTLLYSDQSQRDLDNVLRDSAVTNSREAGIQHDRPFANALVIYLTIEGNFGSLSTNLRRLRNSQFLPPTTDKFDVVNLERGWRLLLSIMPFAEFDEKGMLTLDHDGREAAGQWPVVIELLAPVFSTYEDNVSVRLLDRYCKTLFCRCFHLITYWEWQNWQDILQHLFKFFSTRKLRNLPSEGLCGSPAFLTQLENNPTLEVEDRDSCFHVFLKIIGVSWRRMGKVYDKQRLQNFARRLIPLHERQFPKDESLNQQDLDELRNHHDLLCTLYWVIPENFRFRIATIRWLVQPLSSHTEASLININAWLRLSRFKLSSNEDISGLEPFADWHSSFVKDMLRLHSLARTEIEAQATGNIQYSKALLESVIEENQKQIETLLGTALVNMKLALRPSPSSNHAKAILDGFPLVELLDRFNAINSRSRTVVCQVLDIILAFTEIESCQTTSQRQAPIVIDKNEESQEEYGDWSAFAELSNEDLITPGPGIQYLNEAVRPAILRLASRYFGDKVSDDMVLYRIIDCWVSVATILVRYGLREWSSQFNQYNPESWTSLPWTDHTRKLTPYVFTRLIEADPSIYVQCKQEILKHWISCVVERGSILKHQHVLTSALLNVDGDNPLLTNLPFSKAGAGPFSIALDEFSQRRLSMISSILSNMREHVTDLYQNKSPQFGPINESYRELIETLMRTMRANYQELGQGNQHIQGQYVGFVHRIVAFLQQHVQQICPLDGFFTDPKAFPLPADDPSYIAAKLLSYEVRLSNEKIGMQLVTFIQSVSERAAVDGQQAYFVDQLYSAISQSLEKTRGRQEPMMLNIIIACVLPGYMEVSLKDPVAWILVRPFLQSLTRTFHDLLLHMNVYDHENVANTIRTLSSFFSGLDQSLRLLVDHPGLLDEPRILVTLISYLETVMASIPAIDYLARSTSDAYPLVLYVQVFHQIALFAYACMSDPAAAWAPDMLELDDSRSSIMSAFMLKLRDFATNELKSWLKSTWSHRGGKYYIRQGPRWEEVTVNTECLSMDIVKPAFAQTVTTFASIISHYETFDTHSETLQPW
ncbi:Methyl methanesulfonate-sensitivity protein 22 [Ascosphaera apis ARSEF 7405]|uniref:Methyl methanesulfonate-sensitivity protein 22 n=1 Tax=Ascosphaera apis ARSEF 7405 TaxID=392613 RepID=A0A168BDA5_9EURO|nr:Methyl methanesulfonate-sensitivity protein 22 [Ascosphaera apis ARSEF 7405]